MTSHLIVLSSTVFTTTLLWKQDVNPEGEVARYTHALRVASEVEQPSPDIRLVLPPLP